MKIIKILQKIVGKFLYYYGYIYPTVFVELNSPPVTLEEVQTKTTIEISKQITQFLNYSVTHPEAVT